MQASGSISIIRWLCLGLIITYTSLGLFGRDPWKADEPYSFGITLNFFLAHQPRDWIVPTVGADPFVEKPPLMYWTGALAARLMHRLLSLQESAHLAVAAWVALMLMTLSSTARRMHLGRHGLRVCMLLLGTVGTLGHLHKQIADVPQLAGAVLSLAALVRFVTPSQEKPPRQPYTEGLMLGTGAGIAFMSKGILIPGVLAISGVLLWAVRREFRTRRVVVLGGIAALAALPWLALWPYLFWQTAKPLFIEWFWDNNFGRFFGFSKEVGPARTGVDYWQDIGLAMVLSFPSGWLAIAEILKPSRQAEPAQVVLWVYVIVFLMTVVLASASFREVYLLPVYPALALLAAGAHGYADRVWRVAAIAIAALLGAGLWLCWGLLLTGHGQMLPAVLSRWLPLDYALPWDTWEWVYLLAGLASSALWLGVILWRPRLDVLGLAFAGLTLVWSLSHTLLLPWLNEARSYRSTFSALGQALPRRYDCLAVFNVGESERAMLHYFIGIKPVQAAALDPAPCEAMLVLDKAEARLPSPPGRQWREIWRGARHGDRNERFRAYLKQASTRTQKFRSRGSHDTFG